MKGELDDLERAAAVLRGLLDSGESVRRPAGCGTVLDFDPDDTGTAAPIGAGRVIPPDPIEVLEAVRGRAMTTREIADQCRITVQRAYFVLNRAYPRIKSPVRTGRDTLWVAP